MQVYSRATNPTEMMILSILFAFTVIFFGVIVHADLSLNQSTKKGN